MEEKISMLENIERELLMLEIEEELDKKGSGGPRPHNNENKLREDLEESLKKKASGGPIQHG